MTTFSASRASTRQASRIVTMEPAMFAETWGSRPVDAVQIGLRLVSEGDVERARATAVQRAIQDIAEPGPERNDAYNDVVIREVLARAVCQPEDARAPFFDLPSEAMQSAFTVDAVKLLWHEYDLLRIESCTYLREADDDDLVDLSSLLLDESAWSQLSVAQAKRLRRIAYHLLVQLDPDVRDV